MTLFSFEVPLAYLDLFDEYQDYYFALSFLCRRSKQYYNYIESKVKEGSLVVLDNSYNELDEPDKPEELIRLFNELKPSAVVSPDSDKWTSEELLDAHATMLGSIPPEKVWVVVRTKEEYDFFTHYFSPQTVRCSTFVHRGKALKEGWVGFLHKCEHYLGLVDPVEVNLYSPKTCDTSMPIKLALKDWDGEYWKAEGYPHFHTREWEDFFGLGLMRYQQELAVKNIQWIKKAASATTVG